MGAARVRHPFRSLPALVLVLALVGGLAVPIVTGQRMAEARPPDRVIASAWWFDSFFNNIVQEFILPITKPK